MKEYPWPAFMELVEDEGVTLAAIRVYARIWRRDQSSFYRPTFVKEGVLASSLSTDRKTVRIAIRWLVERGYLIDCGRGAKNARRLQVALVRQLGEIPPQPTAA
jgi:DNA-binding MarR family transcriptional regulator